MVAQNLWGTKKIKLLVGCPEILGTIEKIDYFFFFSRLDQNQ